MKKLATLALITTLAFGNSSCGAIFQDEVVTTQDNVKEEFKDEVVFVPIDWMDDDDEEALRQANKLPVIVPTEAVKDPNAPKVELSNPDKEDFVGSLIDTGIGVGKVFFPGLAGLEALGLLFSRRKRKHYGDAIKALTPYDGQVDLSGAVISLVKGLGLAHSSEGSKEAVIMEEIAERKADAKEETAARKAEEAKG